MSRVNRVPFIAVVAAAAGSAHAANMGSDLIDRNLVEGVTGVTVVYRGNDQPLAGANDFADQFSVYSRGFGALGTGNFWVTPFLLEVTGTEQYTIVAIGTSRNLSGQLGQLSFDFNTIAGDATLQAGKTYTFGYRNAQHTSDGTTVSTVAGSQSIGNVPFTGYNDFSDPWSYVFVNELNVGDVFGSGGTAFDTQGFAGRTYSAQLSTIPAPGTAAAILLAAAIAPRRRR